MTRATQTMSSVKLPTADDSLVVLRLFPSQQLR